MTNFDYNRYLLNTMRDTQLASRARRAARQPLFRLPDGYVLVCVMAAGVLRTT